MADDARPELRVLAPETGDEVAAVGWESIYRETVVLVYRYIYARAGNRADAEDLTTQVYMRALPRLRSEAAIEEIRSYLVATARTVLADHWRTHYDVRFAELDDNLPRPTQRAAVDEESGVHRAAEILGSLPENYRRVLELRFLRGYSVRETAVELGISVTNAKVLQHRALRRAATGSGSPP